VEIDVILDARASAQELSKLGRLAEQNGIRGVWVSSLLDSRDPFTNLSLLADQSSSIRLGPVAVNPFDMHPVRIASALLTLNELARGRASIVIGGGGEALEALGIEPVRRVRAVAECVEILKAAASGRPVEHHGELFNVRNLQIGWLDAQCPLVFVGASMPQMLRMAARVADGIMMSDMPVRLAGEAIATLNTVLDRHGKGRADFQTNAFAAWHVYPSRSHAYAEARRWLVLRGIFRPWVLREFLNEADIDIVMGSRGAFWNSFRRGAPDVDGVPDRVLDALVRNLTFAGALSDLDEKLEKLKAYEAAGLDAISLRLYANPADSIRLLGERVIPRL
jgi:5,10-methylenetetrahydromethanopterin reductase